MNTARILLGVMRLPFVILAPACALVGLGTAYWTTGNVNWVYFLVASLGGVSAHICVNVFNEYLDFRNGLDARTQRTPFSGGSGTLQTNPELAPAALGIALTALALTASIGLFFVRVQGWGIVPLGVLGLVLLYGYTAWMVYHPLLCLLAPGLGFGPLMVMGVHFALTGQYSWTAALASLVPFFLVNDLLLLNQFPDVEADRSVGRRHFPIVIGRKRSAVIYVVFLAGAYVAIAVGAVLRILPPYSPLALLTIFVSVSVVSSLSRDFENIPALIPALGKNVMICLATPALFALGSFIR